MDALVQQVNVTLAADRSADLKSAQSELRIATVDERHLRREHIGKIQKLINTTDVKERLRVQMEKIGAFRLVQHAEKWVKDCLQNLRHGVEQGERYQERIRRILDDLDGGKTRLLDDKKSGDGLSGLAAGSGTAVAQAASGAVTLAHEADKAVLRAADSQFRQADQALSRQSGAIHGQLAVLKKMKWFGRIFQVVGMASSVAVMALTAGLAASVAKAVQTASSMLFRFGGTAAQQDFQRQLARHQMNSTNAAIDAQDLVQKIVWDENDAQKSRQKTNNLLDRLTAVQENLQEKS